MVSGLSFVLDGFDSYSRRGVESWIVAASGFVRSSCPGQTTFPVSSNGDEYHEYKSSRITVRGYFYSYILDY